MFVDQTPKADDRTYAHIMQEQQLEHEKDQVEREMIDRYNAGELKAREAVPSEKRTRFDAKESVSSTPQGAPRRRLDISAVSAAADEKTPNVVRWEETPMRIGAGIRLDLNVNQYYFICLDAATPASGQDYGTTPSQSVRRNRFDDQGVDGGLTPGGWFKKLIISATQSCLAHKLGFLFLSST